MSSLDLSRVVALSVKAIELHFKRHFVRAVEKYADAIAAAEELAQEDCLVVAHLQLQHHTSLFGYSETPGVAAEAASAAKEQSSQALCAAVATLERRSEAGTLLPGTCRSWPEEEWYGHFLQHRSTMLNDGANTPERLAFLVQFVGYDACLYAATIVCGVLYAQPVAASSKLMALGRFAVHAIDLFEQHRPGNWNSSNTTLASENVLTSTMQKMSEEYSPVIGRIEELGLRIPATPLVEVFFRWQRFARSGALRERGFDAGAAKFHDTASASNAATEARLAAATLRCCSLSSCSARELHPKHYKQCGACRCVAYCCREHQLEDWPAHKAACKAARKAAAQEAGGAA